jgi:hypothetical protein
MRRAFAIPSRALFVAVLLCAQSAYGQVFVDADAAIPGVQTTRQAGLGDAVQVDLVLLSGGAAVAGFDVRVSFAPQILAVRDIRLVGAAAGAYQIVRGALPDSLHVAAVREGAAQASADAVVRITFDTKARGQSAIRIASSEVSGPNGARLTLGAADAEISVGQPGCSYTLSSSGVPIPREGGSTSITVSAPGGCEWSVVNGASWITATPSVPAGSGVVGITVAPNPDVNPRSSVLQIAGRAFEIAQAGVTATGPFGSFDSPLDNSTGIVGSIAVTGWALDDAGVTQVRILRERTAQEGAGDLVFIGNAVMVDGARPDVAGTYSTLPFKTRAGWGYLLLTNFLPNQGNGTFRLYAYADDTDGHSTLLGTKTITCTNAESIAPFGAIDTPMQGQSVAGVLNNFGWVLVKEPARADVPGGGSVIAYVDGIAVGVPAGWGSRADITALFPSGFAALNSTLAVLGIDTRQLADGVHTIAWGVTATNGAAAGVGSRFFTVSNGASSRVPIAAPVSSERARAYLDAALPVASRVGYDDAIPFAAHAPDASGEIAIDVTELDRLELRIETPDASARLARVELAGAMADPRHPPAGSSFDPDTGVFTWQLGPGFRGMYDLLLTRRDGVEQRVRLTVKRQP